MKCKCGAFIGSGRLSDTCGQCKTNHESSNKDCLLILEQSERIKELESLMRDFRNEVTLANDQVDMANLAANYDTKIKQLLEKGK